MSSWDVWHSIIAADVIRRRRRRSTKKRNRSFIVIYDSEKLHVVRQAETCDRSELHRLSVPMTAVMRTLT